MIEISTIFLKNTSRNYLRRLRLLPAYALLSLALAIPASAQPPSSGNFTLAQIDRHVTPHLNSLSVLVTNARTGETVYEKNSQQRMPIASITKLMTAMVLLDAGVSMEQPITVSKAEIDRVKRTSSRLAVGTTLTRNELLLIALMSSENRAAAALARTTFPSGTAEFVKQMNRKARSLGMYHTVFYDPTGLDSRNSSTAADLARMVKAAQAYPLIRAYTTTEKHTVLAKDHHLLEYRNSNMLVREGDWDISLQKTGYIQEAGRCLVMQTTVGTQPLIIVLLAADASLTRANDARSIRMWLEGSPHYLLAG